MSRRITARWYIGAWVVWVIAFVALFIGMRSSQGSHSEPAGAMVAYGVMAIAGLVMLVVWIGALIKLGGQHSWG